MGFEKIIFSWTALFPIAVLLYYFFRKRFEVQTISSTLFWEQSMRETRVSPYLKNLQKNALFYLQMAALLFLLFILLGPFINKEELSNGETIIIVDTSASMLANKEGQSIFEKHKVAMKALANERAGQPMTIVTTGKEPAAIIREETDSGVIIEAIENLEVTYEQEFMERAIEFTRSIAADSEADIHVFTDSLDRGEIPEGKLSWTVNTSELAYENVSIDKFGVVKTPDGVEAIIKLRNYSKTDKEGNMLISDALTGLTLAEKNFNVEGEEELLVSFKALPISAAVSVEIMIDDDYEADNVAFTLLGSEMSGAIVDGQLHELVKKAFESMDLSVTTGTGSELVSTSEGLIIVTNDVSLLAESAEPIILIGRNDLAAKPAKGAVTSSADSLFTIADITDVYVDEVYPPFESYKTIASVGNDPFIQKSDRGDLVILSDIEMTDWPLHPSFPLFMWSSVEMHRTEGDILGTFTPNERKAVIGSGAIDGIEVYTVGDEYVMSSEEPSSFVAPVGPGIYVALDGESEKLFSVELESVEKELVEGTTFRIGRMTSEEETESGQRMIGMLFIIPVLCLMLMEWEVQRRRGYPN